MPHGRPITHADLAPSPKITDLGSKTSATLIILTIVCGLFCFVLCLIAEGTRSQAIWVKENSECKYSGSGETPLLCGVVAFVGIAVAMVVQHMYMLIVVSKAPPSALASWNSHFGPAKTLTCLAGFFFVTTWACFAISEILLLIGLSVEFGHLKDWSTSRPSCLVNKQGLFSAAGVFSLATVFLAAGLYLTALRAQRLSQEHENARREMLEASVLYASPPRSPRDRISAAPRENPVGLQTEHGSFALPPSFGKHLLSV